MGSFLSGVEPALNSLLFLLCAEPLITATVMYRHFQGVTHIAGQAHTSFDDYPSITCVKMRHTTQSIRKFGSDIQVNDTAYIIRTSDISIDVDDMSLKDKIVDNGKEYTIIDKRPILSLAVVVSCKGM